MSVLRKYRAFVVFAAVVLTFQLDGSGRAIASDSAPRDRNSLENQLLRVATPRAEPDRATDPLDYVLRRIRRDFLRPVSLGIRNILRKLKSQSSRSKNSDAVSLYEFYEHRNFRPLWIYRSETLNEDAIRLVDRVEDGSFDGLSTVMFPVALPPPDLSLPPVRLAELEIAVSQAIYRYVRAATVGMLDPKKVNPNVRLQPRSPELASVLAEASEPDASIDVMVASRQPSSSEFQRILGFYRELRSVSLTWRRFVSDRWIARYRQALRGSYSSRLSRTRSSTSMPVRRPAMAFITRSLPPPRSGHLSGLPVHRPRMAFKTWNLPPFWHPSVHKATTAEWLSRAKQFGRHALLEELMTSVRATIEHWRWSRPLRSERGNNELYVEVNIPEYRLRVRKDDASVYESRVVVGSVSNPTPVFSDEIEYLVLDPSWYLPRSIVLNELVGTDSNDAVAERVLRGGYEVTLLTKEGRHRVLPSSVDWSAVRDGQLQVRLRQPPGNTNALGRMKFIFPNEDAIYIHGTSEIHAFSRENRALSHGCVRVRDPFRLAGVLSDGERKFSTNPIRKAISRHKRTERRIPFSSNIPVNLTYLTLRIDPDGGISRFRDVYGIHKETIDHLSFH